MYATKLLKEGCNINMGISAVRKNILHLILNYDKYLALKNTLHVCQGTLIIKA